MILLIIRHGQSEADLLDVHEGRADFPLTDLGHQQAAHMAEYVSKTYTLDRIYASPLKRAAQTAQHLSAASGIAVETDELLMEFNNGLIAGLNREDAARRYPQVPDLPSHQALYQQESMLDFRFRAEHALSRIISENEENAVIALVSHGGMINQLYHAFLSLPLKSDLWVLTGDCGFHAWQIREGKRRILFANRMAPI